MAAMVMVIKEGPLDLSAVVTAMTPTLREMRTILIGERSTIAWRRNSEHCKILSRRLGVLISEKRRC
jgi:hypothetical protein